jgi:hypothetical protein
VTGAISGDTSSSSLLSNPNPNKAAAPAPYFQPCLPRCFLQPPISVFCPITGTKSPVLAGKFGFLVTVASSPALDGTGKFGFLATTSSILAGKFVEGLYATTCPVPGLCAPIGSLTVVVLFAKTASLASSISSAKVPALGPDGFLNHPIESGLITFAVSAALFAALAASAPCAIAFTPLRAVFAAVAAFPIPGINPAADNPNPAQSLLSALLPIPKISPITGINSAVSNKPLPNLRRFLPF